MGRSLFNIVKERIKYHFCYKKNGKVGIAIFGICGKWKDKKCYECPYRLKLYARENEDD